MHILQIVEKLEVRKVVKLTNMCHLFSLEISFFEILANFAVIFRDEGVEIAKIGDDIGERATQELFEYQIRFSVALTVAEIYSVKETSLFSDFWLIFRIIDQLGVDEIL